jgi:hypothetical protein
LLRTEHAPHAHLPQQSRRSGESWSLEEDLRLKQMVSDGRAAREIAFILSRTTRAVRRRTEVLKISWKAARQ